MTDPFREALDAYRDAAYDAGYEGGFTDGGVDAMAAARAEVERLYAARVGVECVVTATGQEDMNGPLTTFRVAPVEGGSLPLVRSGDRVFVSKGKAG